MFSRILILLAAVLSGALVSCSTPEAGSVAGIKTSFVPEARLSGRELRQIVALAQQSGISQAGGVSSYHIIPSSMCGFQVSSVETIRGRRVSYLTLNVNHTRWEKPQKDDFLPVQRRLGGFWTQTGVDEKVVTTFVVHGKTVRAQWESGLSLATADKIVRLFERGKYRFKHAKDKEYMGIGGKIDVSELAYVGRGERAGTYMIDISRGECCSISFTFTMDGNIATIVEVTGIVA
jgi:hypothetical protein